MIPNANENVAKRFPQVIASIIATLGGLCLGTVIGWNSPADGIMRSSFKPGDIEMSWISSIMTLGGFSSLFLMAVLMDRLGRKITMICIVPLYLLGYAVLTLAQTNVIGICIGRFITGLGGASFGIVAPVYISEIGENNVRGFFGVLFQLQVTIGILYAYVAGLSKSIFLLSLYSSIPPIVFVLLIFLMPESPIFLIAKSKHQDAAKSLQWLRGKQYDITKEMRDIQKLIDEKKQRKGSLKELCRYKASSRALFIAIVLMFCQQLSGVNVLVYYAVRIFEHADASMDAYKNGVILGAILVVATFVTVFTVNKVGHRTLLILSHAGMGVCMSVLGLYFYIKEMDKDIASSISWLILPVCCVYLFFYSMGSGPLPWIMIGELFSTQVKGAALSISMSVKWLLTFSVAVSFLHMISSFRWMITFFIYAGICIICTVFIYLYVIETRNRTLQEIEMEIMGVNA